MSIKLDGPRIGYSRAAKCHAGNGYRAFWSILLSMFLCVKECTLCVKDAIPCVKSFILRIKEPASGISDSIICNKWQPWR